MISETINCSRVQLHVRLCLIETGFKVSPKRYASTHEDEFIVRYEGEHA